MNIKEKTDQKLAFNTMEVVEMTGINRNLLDSFRRRGLIKAIKVGRYYLYPRSELESFLDRNLNKEITKEGLILNG